MKGGEDNEEENDDCDSRRIGGNCVIGRNSESPSGKQSPGNRHSCVESRENSSREHAS